MSPKNRHIRRDDWSFRDRTYARQRIDFHGMETEAQLMRIGHADAPFTVPSSGGRLTIADDGYCWLQLAPKGGNWWMTAMYTPQGAPVQYYFDITTGNRVSGGKDAWFEDMYLDYVLYTDGRLVELDRDELDAALDAGTIASEQYGVALRTGDALKTMLNEAVMAEFDAIYSQLRAQALRTWDQL